jgi:phosphoribosylglycinamide formyltransferase-1
MNIAIFASGSGSNAENISKYFSNSKKDKVSFILSNKKDAYVLERAKNLGILSLHFSKDELADKKLMLGLMQKHKIDFIILAGYLKLIPNFLIEAFPNKIINIHPALLPKFGGKGMYGMNVHKAVVEKKETETGISIHYVNAKYDEGQIIAQFKCKLDKTDTPEDVADKIHELEMENFPKVIENVLE